MQSRDDHLLHDMIDLRFFFQDRGEAVRHRLNDAIRHEHAKERADKRRADQAAKNNRRLVNRTHGLHHAQNARNDSKRWQRASQRGERVRWVSCVIHMLLDRSIHDFFNRIGVEISRRNHHQPNSIGDEMKHMMIFHDLGIFTENRARFRAFHMGFQRNRTVNAQNLEQL